MPEYALIPLDKGLQKQTPNRIILHAMGEFIDTETEDAFAVDFIRSIGLSVHAFITPSGVTIISRDDTQGAYHARGHNKNTLGVEFLVSGLHSYSTFVEAIQTPYLTDKQYNAGVALVKDWVTIHNIIEITRHSDVSPGRKLDPGNGFPFKQFLEDVRK